MSRIPSVSLGVVCFHSDVLGCSWTFTVIVFKDLRGSTLCVSMYISLALSLRRFAYAAHVGCLSDKLDRLFLTPHSFSVTLFTLGFRLFFILLQINQPTLSKSLVLQECTRDV